MWYIKRDKKRNIFCPVPWAHPPQPLSALFTGVRCGAGCQLEYPLTSNLWPPAPQNSPWTHPAGSTSCETKSRRERRATVSYRCYRCSLHCFHCCLHPSFTARDPRDHKNPLVVDLICPCEFACQSPICPDAPEDPAVPWWRAACYKEIRLQERRAFILIKETCALFAQLIQQTFSLCRFQFFIIG